MKLAFSSVGCPGWDLPTMIEKAKEYGYEGIELGGLDGPVPESAVPELAADPAKIAQLARDAGVEIICLATSAAFHMTSGREVAENQARVREYVELAAKLGCPFVRVLAGEIPGSGLFSYERRDTVLGRIGGAIRELVPHATEHGVTILIENAGDFVDSPSVWYLLDAADSPAVRCCWNPLVAAVNGERPTRSIPRLGARIGLVRICDGRFGDDGVIERYVPPGEGDVEIRATVQFLRGIAYRGYLVFDWPKLSNSLLAEPRQVFPAAAKYLRQLLDEKPILLTAYKGDKFKPRQGFEFAAS
ncbi:MAG: sugar phosphate isomerase/epimerase [Phycisphaerae bacterium]|nr:sugar phosphate isomerase/epimerase [Phycisphaerae bacterium]